MSFDPATAQRFTYDGYSFDRLQGLLSCRYRLDDLTFTETIALEHSPVPAVADPVALDRAARLVFLLAGVSYYKAAAPPIVDFGLHELTPAEAALLRSFYLDGLGEYAYRNGLDLSGVAFEYHSRDALAGRQAPTSPQRPLIPFGGGIDSIVTVELVRPVAADAALFVVGAGIDAIERPAAITGLPIVRATRTLDAKILRSRELGYRNGHVPITGILSSIAILASVAQGYDAVIMSNEWSASRGNTTIAGREINHQFSKSLAFETLFRDVLAETIGPVPEYFSLLRPLSELRIAQLFSRLTRYHSEFRSCNRAFHVDPRQRLDRWCGVCDKCCFIDLILAPFVSRVTLDAVFDGGEPLANAELLDRFLTLVGATGHVKPFECVGDVGECRAAAHLASARTDRAGNEMLSRLTASAPLIDDPELLMTPIGPHYAPSRYDSFAFVG